MAKTQKIKVKDRISNLPKDVMECIMEFLPLRDAARTCVLSRNWRFVWANHPSLVLDDSVQKFDAIDYANIVSSILLSHFGHIQKFIIDVTDVNVNYNNVDLWLSYLCRKSLKVLHFYHSVDVDDLYEVPSCVFLTSELTQLSLHTCCIRMATECFTNIQSLILEYVKLDSVLLTTPLLTSLTIMRCFYYGDDDDDFVFDISAPRLASLTLDDNEVPNIILKPFFTCTDIDYTFLSSYRNRNLVEGDGKHLVELLAFWPKISVLVVDGFCFEHLAATGSSIPDNEIILPLNLRRFVLLDVNLDSEKIARILYILKNSPLLHTFEISIREDVMNDIDEPLMKEFKMDQLRTVKMKGFTASRNEVMFVKVLLKCAPLLGKMLVEENDRLYPDKQIKILKELLLLQRKYRNTEIIFAPKI